MGISERTLRKWRREALVTVDTELYQNTKLHGIALTYVTAQERILKMTQELLDQHLLRKGERK